MRGRFIYIVALFLMLMPSLVVAQNMPERIEVRSGNKAYNREDYEKAVEKYTKAMALAPKSFEAKYNLASAHIKSGNGAEAEKILKRVAADSLLSNSDRSNAYYNLGNSQFLQGLQGKPDQQGQPQMNQAKLKAALESYKNAMRFDPADMEAKYNYAFTKALLESQPPQDDNQDDQDQDGDGDGEGDSDQNQDGDQGQNGDQGQDDNGDDEQEQNGGGDDEDDEDEQESQPQERDGEISEQLQQQMLDAIQAQEDKTQEDLKERAKGVVVRGAKNW